MTYIRCSGMHDTPVITKGGRPLRAWCDRPKGHPGPCGPMVNASSLRGAPWRVRSREWGAAWDLHSLSAEPFDRWANSEGARDLDVAEVARVTGVSSDVLMTWAADADGDREGTIEEIAAGR